MPKFDCSYVFVIGFFRGEITLHRFAHQLYGLVTVINE